MTLEAVFPHRDDAGDALVLRPDAQGWYLLPPVRLFLMGTEPVWVDHFTCRAEGLPPSARAWAERLTDAWRGTDPRGRRLDATYDVWPTPVPHPGFTDVHGATALRLVVDIEYFHVDPLTGREVRGIPYRCGTWTTVLFGAPEPVSTATPQAAAPPTAPSSPATETSFADGLAARARRRVADEDEQYLGHAAIDYGTSNSTVTLYDGQFKDRRSFSPAQVARLRTEILRRVLGEPFPDAVRAEWESVLALAGAGLDGAGAGHGRSPAEVVASETGTEALFRLCLMLEQRIADCSHLLRTDLAARLHRCYDAAFTVPPLEQMRLFRVELGDGVAEMSSRLEVLSADPLTVRLGEPERPMPGATTPGSGGQRRRPDFRGLKLRLNSPRVMDELPGDPPPTSDQLIQSALEYLVDRSDRYIERQAVGRLGSGRINDLVVTYPTVATPDVRRRLKSLVSEGLGVSRVSMHFDEAVAAVMFFVMRDFGGDLDVGIESFRARSRRIGEGTDWTQNILLVDIGGGTTDMALLTLSLADTTPVEVLKRSDTDRLGRHYTLTPTVMGSSGHTRLGGDLLTLSVFHWLKAELADRLIAAQPDRFRTDLEEAKSVYLDESGQYVAGKLSAAVRSRNADDCAQARRLAEAAVPTRWRTALTTERELMHWTFEQLWKLADQAKIHLGGADTAPGGEPSPYHFGEQELSGLLDNLAHGDGSRVSIGFELDAAGFRLLVEDHLKTVAALADGMLRERLPEGRPLDRVVLTGKSCSMPLVRDVLVRGLGQGHELTWDPANIEVEREYAKTATSIGAAWAEQVRQASFTSKGSVQALTQGRSVVQINVENLFFSLPCRFELGMAAGGKDLDLFGTNTMLHHLVHTTGEPPALAVRTEETRDIQEVIRIMRVRQGADNITWGQFKCPEPRVGAGPSGGVPVRVWPNRIRARFEITADLDVFAYFSQGEPHYTVPSGDPSINVWQRLARAGLVQPGERPDSLPVAIHANYTIAGSSQPSSGTEIFSAGSTFTEVFHGSDAPHAPARAGLLGARLPEPFGSGEWEFGVFLPDQDSMPIVSLGRLRCPDAEAGSRALFVASLDSDGALRIHLGGVPFWAARDTAQVEQEEGRVLRHLMTVQDKDRDDLDDPFGGLQ